MQNIDVVSKEKAEITAKIAEAVKSGDEEAFAEAFGAYTHMLQDAVMAEAKGLVEASDNRVLVGRGVRTLTSEETKYYQKLIGIMQGEDPKSGLAGYDAVLPETVIDAIFEDITEEHPLLSVIDFQNTAALTKYLYSTMDARHLASWGPLCGPINNPLAAEFKMLSLEQTKLSAYIPICKAMLDLGPAWLDRYVRTILAEAISNGLEDGIINGVGPAPDAATPIEEPIGMVSNLTSYATATGYAPKSAEAVNDFMPETYLPLVADLLTVPLPKGDPNDGEIYRRVSEVLLIVNPVDYLTKVIPATIYARQADGSYVSEIFPFPTKVVQSAYVASGQAILGIAKRYLMAMGTGKGGKIEYSDEFRFLDDERVYLTKLYGNGRPLDNNSFKVLNISGLKPRVPKVDLNEFPQWPAWPALPEWGDTTLQALTFGEKDGTPEDLTPEFSHVKYQYTVAKIESAEGTEKYAVEGVPADSEATVAYSLNGALLSTPAEFSLAEGLNTIVATVTNNKMSRNYIIIVEYETGA